MSFMVTKHTVKILIVWVKNCVGQLEIGLVDYLLTRPRSTCLQTCQCTARMEFLHVS